MHDFSFESYWVSFSLHDFVFKPSVWVHVAVVDVETCVFVLNHNTHKNHLIISMPFDVIIFVHINIDFLISGIPCGKMNLDFLLLNILAKFLDQNGKCLNFG